MITSSALWITLIQDYLKFVPIRLQLKLQENSNPPEGLKYVLHITWTFNILVSGVCPFGGLLIYDGFYHMGTFCGDGSYTLPVGKALPLATSQLMLIEYSMSGKGELTFSYKVDLVQRTSAIHNPCNFAEQQYALLQYLNISDPTPDCHTSKNYGLLSLKIGRPMPELVKLHNPWHETYTLSLNWYHHYLEPHKGPVPIWAIYAPVRC